VPGLVRTFTQSHHTPEKFVAMSQALAKHLFEIQHGAISPGLLSVLDVAIDGQRGLTMMKLEREEGARLELTQRSGKTTFDMSVLDNLVLTDGTRLFKTALFIRTGDGDDDFVAAACDTQLNVVSSDDMAKFWLRFLGCTFAIEPRVATQRFYDSTLSFINENVTNPIHKNDLYEHLHSQLKASKKTFSPLGFIEDYVPTEYHTSLREHLTAARVPFTSFTKDLSDISAGLRRLAYHTKRGALVSVPAEAEELVDIAKDRITVKDTLLRVGTK
ncbi:MAG: nucleoid-associated protein, partial [Candidatus Acidiferrum sp.]